jgi:HSP20 family protein
MQRVIYMRRPHAGRDQQGLQQQLERAFQREWGQPQTMIVIARDHDIWRPAADVYETDTAFVIKVELAGMRDAQIAITLDERSLRIEGQRPEQRDEHLACYHQIGVSYGAFAVEVFLARPVDYERVTAHYDDGFLFVELPKPTANPAGSRLRVQISE